MKIPRTAYDTKLGHQDVTEAEWAISFTSHPVPEMPLGGAPTPSAISSSLRGGRNAGDTDGDTDTGSGTGDPITVTGTETQPVLGEGAGVERSRGQGHRKGLAPYVKDR